MKVVTGKRTISNMSPYLIKLTREYLVALAEQRTLLATQPENKEHADRIVTSLTKVNDKVSSAAAVLFAYGIVDRQGNLVEDKE